MDVHFDCTRCGKCCNGLKLPLTVSEAIAWLTDGHPVQLICEAMPWLEEPAADDHKAAHRRRRSFASMSGSMPSRVVVILAAHFAGNCPNLRTDMRCGIYERRPLVCRIYPAEINPYIQLDPAKKACLPEAWGVQHPLLLRDGRVLDDRVHENIQQSRDTDRRNVQIKRRLCAALNLNSAALADEGFVVYSPDRAILLTELGRAAGEPDGGTTDAEWRFISNRTATRDALARQGALVSLVADGNTDAFQYLGFHSASPGPTDLKS
jgi:Fe-S-cluster containining protein